MTKKQTKTKSSQPKAAATKTSPAKTGSAQAATAKAVPAKAVPAKAVPAKAVPAQTTAGKSTKTTKSAQSRKKAANSSSFSTTMIVIITVAILGVVGLGYLLWSNLQGEEAMTGVVQQSGLSRDHDNSLTYTGGLPPMGGAHFDVWQTCGVYDEVVNPGYGIHSMEHGAVWITYDPAIITAEQLTAIRQQVREENYLILSPFPDQSSPLALTAWGTQLELDSADDPRVADFIDRYRLGPNTPERGASCVGGNGEPL